MRGMSLLSILAVVFALVLAWQCVLLIQLGLSNLDTPKTLQRSNRQRIFLPKLILTKANRLQAKFVQAVIVLMAIA